LQPPSGWSRVKLSKHSGFDLPVSLMHAFRPIQNATTGSVWRACSCLHVFSHALAQPAATACSRLMEIAMFENQQRDDIEALMKANTEFRRLYQRHQKLDSKVRDAEIGALPMDGDTLASMKREKLAAKHRLLRMWDAHRHHTTH